MPYTLFCQIFINKYINRLVDYCQFLFHPFSFVIDFIFLINPTFADEKQLKSIDSSGSIPDQMYPLIFMTIFGSNATQQ